MFTSKDVAERAGVSQSTVSYVVSGKRPISEKTRARVQAVIDELTWQPNAGARALASQRSQVIGLVAPLNGLLDSDGLLPFLQVIVTSARERDHEVLLVTTAEGPSALTRLAGGRLCDAMVVMDVEARDERVDVARDLVVPVIFIGLPDDCAGLSCVDVDFELSGTLAVEELAATGHDHLVLVGWDASAVSRGLNFVERFERGVRRAAASRGLSLDVLSPVEATTADACSAADRILAVHAERGSATGVVVPHTQVIQHLLTALAARSAPLGRGVSVIGSCTDAAAAAMVPPPTNVSLEPRDVSRRAMDTLFARLDGSDLSPPGVHMVAPRLTRRATSPAG